jgi:hypothetical protein
MRRFVTSPVIAATAAGVGSVPSSIARVKARARGCGGRPQRPGIPAPARCTRRDCHGSESGSSRPPTVAARASARSGGRPRGSRRHAAGRRARVRRDRTGDTVESRHVVPEMGIGVLAVDAEDVRHRHDDAAVPRRGVLELRHERVVAEAVLDHEPGVRHRQPVGGARLEEVRVRVRASEDRRHGDMAAADLGSDVPVDVLGRDDDYAAARRLRPATTRRQEEQEQGGSSDNKNGSHPHLR